MIKKIFIFVLVLAMLAFTLYGAKNYIKLSDIRKSRKIALVSFQMPKDMINPLYDKVKYLNNQVYIDYIANSFITNFNNANEYMKIEPVSSFVDSRTLSLYPVQYPVSGVNAAASGTLAIGEIPDSLIRELEGKVDSYMFVKVYASFWSQRVVFDFEIYDLNKELIWEGIFEGSSRYIITDTSITPKTGYQIVINEIMEYQKRHQSELYIVLDEAIVNSISNMVRRYPTAFKKKTGYEMIRTFSLTNENYAKKAGIPEWKNRD